jgi:hypothetical protein
MTDPCEHQPTTVRHKTAMLRTLYDHGYGYHQIADLAQMTHEQMRTFLAAGIAERQWEYLLSLDEQTEDLRIRLQAREDELSMQDRMIAAAVKAERERIVAQLGRRADELASMLAIDDQADHDRNISVGALRYAIEDLTP